MQNHISSVAQKTNGVCSMRMFLMPIFSFSFSFYFYFYFWISWNFLQPCNIYLFWQNHTSSKARLPCHLICRNTLGVHGSWFIQVSLCIQSYAILHNIIQIHTSVLWDSQSTYYSHIFSTFSLNVGNIWE